MTRSNPKSKRGQQQQQQQQQLLDVSVGWRLVYNKRSKLCGNLQFHSLPAKGASSRTLFFLSFLKQKRSERQ
jgi:hypothetical protein